MIENLFYLLSNAFGFYVLFRFINVFYKSPITHKKTMVVTMITFYAINSTLHILFGNPYLNITTYLITIFTYTSFYKKNIKVKLFTTILVVSITTIADAIFYSILGEFFEFNYTGSLTNILANIFLFSFTSILEKIYQNMEETSRVSSIELISMALISIGSITIIINIFSNNYNYMSLLIIVTILLIINVLIFYLYKILSDHYKDQQEKELLIQQNIAYMNQYKLIEENQKNINILRHDTKNHLIAVRKLCEENSIKGIVEYLDQFDKYSNSRKEYIATANMHINSIVNYKLKNIDNIGTKITINVNFPQQLLINKFDMTVILGNLLDNAFEALEKTEDKQLNIDIEFDREILYIHVDNTYEGGIKIKNGKLISKKQDKQSHGLGIMSIENVVNKYEGSIAIDYSLNVFKVDIMMHNMMI